MRCCYVPGCRSGYDKFTATGRHFFRPPKDGSDFYKWATAIRRMDTKFTSKSCVCDLHFSDDLIEKADSFLINGDRVEIPRLRWRLKPGAVPHIFPNLQTKSRTSAPKGTAKKSSKLSTPVPEQSTSYVNYEGSRKTTGRGKRRLKVLRSPERATADDDSVLPSTSKEFEFFAVKQEPPDESADVQIEFEAVKQEPWEDPEPGESAANQDFQFVSVKQEPPDESDFHVPEDFVAVKLEPCEDTEVGDSAATQGFDFVSVKQEPLEESDLNVPEDFVAVKLEPCDDTEATTQDLTAREEQKVQSRSRFVASSSRLPNSGDDFMFPEVIVNTESGRDETSVQPSRIQESSTAGCGENDEQQTVSGQYTCSSCLCVFSSKYSLTMHVFTHLEGVNAPRHVCQLCGLVVASRLALAKHMRDRGDPLPSLLETVITEKKLFCSVCREDLKAEGCLRAHMAEHARDDTLTRHNSAAEPSNKCKKCGVSFGTGRALARHNCPNETYYCKLCKKYFRSAIRLEKHYLTHGKKRFVCQICNRSFARYSRLRLHTNRFHTQDHLYICDICRKGFADRYSLAGHKALHNQQQLFGCGACGKYFLTAQAFKKHTIVHSRDNQYNYDISKVIYTAYKFN